MTGPVGPWGSLEPVGWAVRTGRIPADRAPAWAADFHRRPVEASALLRLLRPWSTLLDLVDAVLPPAASAPAGPVVTGPLSGDYRPPAPVLSVLLSPAGAPAAPVDWAPVLVVEGLAWPCRSRVAHLYDTERIRATAAAVDEHGRAALPALYVATWQSTVPAFAELAPWLLAGGPARVRVAIEATAPLVAGYEARHRIHR